MVIVGHVGQVTGCELVVVGHVTVGHVIGSGVVIVGQVGHVILGQITGG